MDFIIDIILPVFGVLGLGYGAARAGFFDEAANRGLSLFVFNFAIPLLLFRAIGQAQLPEHPPWGYLASYYLGAFLCFGVAMFAGRRALGQDLGGQAVMGLGAAFSNTSMLGIPLVLTAYGPDAALPLFVLLAVHSLLLLPPATMLAELGSGERGRLGALLWRLGKSVATTPLIVGLAAGLLTNLLGWKLPGPVDAVAKSLGASATPCALFALGASLTRYRIRGDLRAPLLLVALKIVLHPLLAWVMCAWLFPVSSQWTAVAVTIAALPAGVTPYLYAQRYGRGESVAASAVFIGTVLSALTLSAVVWVFRPAG